MQADGNSNGPGPAVAGRVWTQLRELGFMHSSLQFAALFTLGFIPFLIVLSVALGPGLTHAMVMGSGFNARAGHDVTMLFSHSRTAPASLSGAGSPPGGSRWHRDLSPDPGLVRENL